MQRHEPGYGLGIFIIGFGIGLLVGGFIGIVFLAPPSADIDSPTETDQDSVVQLWQAVVSIREDLVMLNDKIEKVEKGIK